MEVNALDFVMDVILLEMGANDKLHLVTFYFKKLSIIKNNYKIHDKEFLVITNIFQEWHHYLKNTSSAFIVYMDHQNLKYFISTCILNCWQADWNMLLSNFDFKIIDRPK